MCPRICVRTAICFHSTTANVDYVTLVQNITFESGEQRKDFNVTILNDARPEIDESFEVILESLPDFPDVNIGVPSVAVGTILDDDLPGKHFIMLNCLNSPLMYINVSMIITKVVLFCSCPVSK